MRALPLMAALCLSAASPALADTVVVTVKGLHSDKGQVLAQLCDDPRGFPGGRCPYKARVPAKAGDVDVTFENVKPGQYAFSAFHDENANFNMDQPMEGFSFSGGQSYPPNFDKAKFDSATASHQTVTMVYQFGPGAQPTASNGVAAPAGVVKTDVRDHGLYAELYAPAGAKKLPVIIAFGGSEGGLDTFSAMSASFSKQGYAVLVLAYWRAPGLPEGIENIPLEYFKKAIDWVKTRPEIDPRRIGMIGWSRGAEAALLVASHYPDVKAVCAVAPTGNVWGGFDPRGGFDKPAWTFQGKPLKGVAVNDKDMLNAVNNREMFEHVLARSGAAEDNAIPVEHINGPVLLLSGDEDKIWPSSMMSRQVVDRLHAKGFRFPVTHLAYPGAGHAVFVGGTADPLNFEALRSFMGGSAKADGAAWADDWPKTVKFFDDALKGKAR